MDLANSMHLRGRKAQPLGIAVERELSPDDLEMLVEERGTAPAPIQSLRAKHHRLARTLAKGVSQTEAAYISGFTPSRVSILRDDPTFRELERHYLDIEEETFRTAREKLADLAEDAVDIIHDRVIGDPDGMTTDELLRIGAFAADRSGHGPSSKTEVDVKFGLADRLEAARERLRLSRMKDVTPEEIV